MDWQTAIKESEKGTATRYVQVKNRKHTFVRYSDGSAYMLVSKDGIVNYNLSRKVDGVVVDGFIDWEPSK